MKIKMLAGLVLLIFATGCVAMVNLEQREKVYGKGAPVITEHFAAKEVRPGDTWKIYLKASDPEGGMKYIVATVQQIGVGVYPVSFTRIQSENRKELSGYVYLNTTSGFLTSSLTFSHLTLSLQIQDRAGHFSEVVAFPLAFGSRTTTQELPPPGVFKEQDLGPVMVSLHAISAEVDTGRSGWIH